MAEEMTAARTATLSHVDPAPAQTWNWLAINETSLEVPLTEATERLLADGATMGELIDTEVPDTARGLVMGAGTQATGWIDAQAASRTQVSVPAGTDGGEIVVPCLVGENGLAQTTVTLGADARAQVRVLALGNETGDGITGSALRLVLEPGACCSVALLVAQGAGQRHVDSLGAVLGDDAELTIDQYVLGSESSAVGVAADLAGDGASVEAALHYIGRAGQTVDASYEVSCRGRKTCADIACTGVLTGDAKKTLRATIDLVRGCKGAEGSESETVVLAGDAVVNKTLPVILCSEDDVVGNHGATIGSLSPEQLFYLGCRGITETDAADLMVSALVDDAAATLGGEAAEAVCAWASWSLGPEAAENARDAAGLAAGEKE
ncbi:SufD family Fe-S cluster assembly protein [Atopobiaceae bacterium 24-176]